MTKTTEVSRARFDRAEEQQTSKGTIQIDRIIAYGFFINDTFYYTISGKYYGVTEAK